MLLWLKTVSSIITQGLSDTLTQRCSVFYNTSFKGVRSARDNNDGYVVVEGLTGQIGPLFLGCMYSRLWFKTSAGELS